jgi:Flp pilus assembly protein TadG
MSIKTTAASFFGRGQQFLRDRRGLAAIEFALLAPLLIALYFLAMEAGRAIEANGKVDRIGAMVGDLVTQQPTVNASDLDAIMRIGEATLQPYIRSQPTITVTAIEISDEAQPKARVVWSRKLADGAFSAGEAKDEEVTIPPSLMIAGSFLIRAESNLNYQPVITWVASGERSFGFDSISMGEAYYLRPRMSRTISCPDC